MIAILAVPVSKANVPPVVGGNPATVVDDAEDDETEHGDHFDDAEDELDCVPQMSVQTAHRIGCVQHTFTVTFDPKVLDDDQQSDKDGDPDADVVLVPIADGQARGRDLER